MMTIASTTQDVALDPGAQHQAALLVDRMDCELSRQTLPSRSVLQKKASATSSVLARDVRIGYGLLQAAIEEAVETVECRNVKVAAEIEVLQERAIRSIHASALATIDLFEALSAAQTPAEFASRQMEHAQPRWDTVNGRLAEFFESARNIVSTDPQRLQPVSCVASTERGAPDADESVLSRLNTLTGRQKMVLTILTEGLPNKVIAHQLGISETTVKAHVGEILRKLKVYNRARAIVMLAQFDMSQIRSLP